MIEIFWSFSNNMTNIFKFIKIIFLFRISTGVFNFPASGAIWTLNPPFLGRSIKKERLFWEIYCFSWHIFVYIWAPVLPNLKSSEMAYIWKHAIFKFIYTPSTTPSIKSQTFDVLWRNDHINQLQRKCYTAVKHLATAKLLKNWRTLNYNKTCSNNYMVFQFSYLINFFLANLNMLLIFLKDFSFPFLKCC